MTRSELLEWIAMLLIIVLWWPVLFMSWSPDWYRWSLTLVSAIVLTVIFVRRLRQVNEGFAMSESMMRARIEAEELARGGKPDLDEKTPPDVSVQLPFTPPDATEKGTQPFSDGRAVGKRLRPFFRGRRD
jgi:hypothetical protein